MTDEAPPTVIHAVGSPEFERQQHDAAMKRADSIINWMLVHPKVTKPFASAEFRRAFPDVTRADVKLAIDEVASIAKS